MTTDDQIQDVKLYNMILIYKLQNYQSYYQANMISMSILLVKKYYHLIKKKIIEPAKFTYSLMGKALEKHTNTMKDKKKRQVNILKTLKPKELEAIESESVDNVTNEVFNGLSDEKLGETYNTSK